MVSVCTCDLAPPTCTPTARHLGQQLRGRTCTRTQIHLLSVSDKSGGRTSAGGFRGRTPDGTPFQRKTDQGTVSVFCCVHNMSPFVSSSGLFPGSREAKVQRAKVCLNCTEPSVARSFCWSLPVGRYLSDTCCKGSVVVLAR